MATQESIVQESKPDPVAITKRQAEKIVKRADPPARRVAADDLAEFRALSQATQQAQARVQQATMEATKYVGAWEHEYARLRRRYRLAPREDFDTETGVISVAGAEDR